MAAMSSIHSCKKFSYNVCVILIDALEYFENNAFQEKMFKTKTIVVRFSGRRNEMDHDLEHGLHGHFKIKGIFFKI